MENEIKRMNYFDGQFLKERDFQEEQYYHRHMRRRMNYLMFETSGTVQINPDDLTFINIDKTRKTFQVKSGMAVSLNTADREGKEIILREDSQAFNLNELGFGDGQTAFVTIHYAEQLDKDPPSEGDIDEDTRVKETPIIEVHKEDWPTGLAPNNENYIFIGSIPNDEDMEPFYEDRQFATLRTTLLNIETVPPIFELSTNIFNFTAAPSGPSPPDQVLVINNIGGGELSWTASIVGGGAGWLKIDPNFGTAPGNITLSADVSSLPAGNFTETIRISSPEATNSPKEVIVDLAVVAEPVLDVSPVTINFSAKEGGTNPASQKVQVNNSGGGALTWNAKSPDNQPWLTVSPGSGGVGDEITISADISGLSSGTFSGQIQITSPQAINSPQNVNVTLSVSRVPIISVSPDRLNFSAVLGDITIDSKKAEIKNDGGETLNWKATVMPSPISNNVRITPDQGTAPSEISVAIGIRRIPAGTYNGVIRIESSEAPNSPQDILYSLKIVELVPFPQLQPIQLQPIQLQPVQLQPVQLQPVQRQPIQLQPIQRQPIQLQPIQRQPIQLQPIQIQPIPQPIQLQPRFERRPQPGPSVVNFEAFPLTAVKDVGSKTETRLTDAGIKSIPELAKSSPAELAKKTKLSEKKSTQIISSAKKFMDDNIK